MHPIHQVASQSQHIRRSHSPCRRSIPQALVGDTHTWHHCDLKEFPLACWIDAIPQAPFRDTPVTSRHIKTSHSPCRRWISQGPTRDSRHKWQQHISKAAIPHVDAQFHTDAHTWHHCVLPESFLACWIDAFQPSSRTKVGVT